MDDMGDFSDLPKKALGRPPFNGTLLLDIYKTVLKLTGSLRLKHDNRDFFHWSLEQLVADSLAG